MKNNTWSKEKIWVARDDKGNIIRAQDTDPAELLVIAEQLGSIARHAHTRSVLGEGQT